VLALLTTACGDAAPSRPAACAPGARLRLGSGVDVFEAVEASTELLFTQGVQGGYHIFVSVRATGIEPRDAEMTFKMLQGDTRIGGVDYLDDLFPDGPDLIYAGATVFLDHVDFPPDEVAGRPARITLDLRDRRGCELRAEMAFVPRCCDWIDD